MLQSSQGDSSSCLLCTSLQSTSRRHTHDHHKWFDSVVVMKEILTNTKLFYFGNSNACRLFTQSSAKEKKNSFWAADYMCAKNFHQHICCIYSCSCSELRRALRRTARDPVLSGWRCNKTLPCCPFAYPSFQIGSPLSPIQLEERHVINHSRRNGYSNFIS